MAASTAVVHFVWLVKADLREPLTYVAVLVMLLGVREVRSIVRRMHERAAMI